MACGCRGGSNGTKSFVYTAPDGTTTTYRTEVEARAAQIRNGGGSYVAQS